MQEKRAAKAASKKKRSFDEADTAANDTTHQSDEQHKIDPKDMIRHKKPTIEERKAEKTRQKEIKRVEDEKLEEKYDLNQRDSDDSSDEEVLIRTGNVPREWYELYEH